jgi:hypothetical protein
MTDTKTQKPTRTAAITLVLLRAIGRELVHKEGERQEGGRGSSQQRAGHDLLQRVFL